jgi:hypothetical protein
MLNFKILIQFKFIIQVKLASLFFNENFISRIFEIAIDCHLKFLYLIKFLLAYILLLHLVSSKIF